MSNYNNGFTLDGERPDESLLTIKKVRPAWAKINRNLLTISGRPGAIITDTEVDILTINVHVEISDNTEYSYRKKVEKLAGWFIRKKPAELIFDGEPDRYYNVYVMGSLDLDELVTQGEGVITFIDVDGYKKGNEITHLFYTADQTIQVLNEGTAEAEPFFKLDIEKDTPFLTIVSDEEFIQLGQPVNLDENTTIDPLNKILEDNMGSLENWSAANTHIENGVVDGKMTTIEGGFAIASDFGVGANWHGPALMRQLPNQLQDFQVEMKAQLSCYGNADMIGRIECVMLDANFQTICKMAFKELYPGSVQTHIEMRVGDLSTGTRLINGQGPTPTAWNDIFGFLRFKRIKNKWYCYIAKLSDGKNMHVVTDSFTDKRDMYNKPVAYIQIHIGKQGDRPSPARLRIAQVRVYDYQSGSEKEIPILFKQGDIVEINTADGSCTKNGEDIKDELDLSSDFFLIQPGMNKLALYPPGVASGEVVHEERFW